MKRNSLRPGSGRVSCWMSWKESRISVQAGHLSYASPDGRGGKAEVARHSGPE
jgi:hypothetical protein